MNHIPTVEASETKREEKMEEQKPTTIDTDECINFTCPDEEDEKPETSQANNSSSQFESPTLNSGSNKKIVDDDEETYETIYENLPENLSPLRECIHKAQGCCLLLILKFFLKEVYSISEKYTPFFISFKIELCP